MCEFAVPQRVCCVHLLMLCQGNNKQNSFFEEEQQLFQPHAICDSCVLNPFSCCTVFCIKMKMSVHCLWWMKLCGMFWGRASQSILQFCWWQLGQSLTSTVILAIVSAGIKKKPLMHICRHIKLRGQRHCRKYWKKHKYAHRKTHLEEDRLHLAT